MFLESMFRITV